MTLNSAFLMTEMARPAAMSPTVAPSFCACFTRLFMNTVQRLPRSTGRSALMAVCANSATSRLRPVAKLSMKLPQPELHASLSMMWSMTPSLTRRCATVSISPESTRSASSNRCSP